MISPNRIRYSGVCNNELNIPDLITCVAFDSDNGETETYLGREPVASESYDGRYKRIHNFKYNQTFSPKFTFTKSNFGNFSMDEVRTTLKWLTSKDTTALLEVYYDDSNVVSWASIGGFVELSLQKLANNRTVAITAVWDSVHPFALSDLYTATKTISAPIKTTMYRFVPTAISGATMPKYFLISKKTLSVGDTIYTFAGSDIDQINKKNTFTYGVIGAIEGDIYTVNGINFTVNDLVSVMIYDMNNSITIDIDTDDNNPVYPRITIKENGINVPIASDKTLNLYSDMVPNTVYYNGTTYYWKSDTPALCVGATEPSYGWTKVTRNTVYAETDEIKEETVYYYTSDQKYRWIDPYTFKSSTSDPKLTTTGVKIINRHYNFFNQPSTPVAMSIKNNTATETVVIDGANKLVSSTNARRIFGDDFDWTWLPLYDGKNELTVDGNCTVTLEWREIRKVGEY